MTLYCTTSLCEAQWKSFLTALSALYLTRAFLCAFLPLVEEIWRVYHPVYDLVWHFLLSVNVHSARSISLSILAILEGMGVRSSFAHHWHSAMEALSNKDECVYTPRASLVGF